MLTDACSGAARSNATRAAYIFPGSPSWATPIASVAASSAVASAGITTAAINTTGATFIVIAASSYVGGGSAAPTDSKGNAWTLLGTAATASQPKVSLYINTAPIVGTGHTFTNAPGGTSYPSIAVLAFGGGTGATTFGLIGKAQMAAPASSYAAGTVANFADNGLILSAVGTAVAAGTLGVGSPFAIGAQSPGIASNSFGVGLAYSIQGAHAPATATWSWASGAVDIASLSVAVNLMAPGSLLDTQTPRLVVASADPALPVTQVPRLVVAPTTDVRTTQVVAEVAIRASADLRATQLVAEVALFEMAPALRATQLVAEVAFYDPPPAANLNITQAPRLVAALSPLTPTAVTQLPRLAAVEIGSPVRVTQQARVLPLMTPTAPARLTQLPRLSIMAPAVPQCFGGAVPRLPDPPDGDTWTGLGPHVDRLFLEFDLDGGRELWALHDPMNDPPSVAHGGHKEGRLLTVDVITRRTTDRLGGWQVSGARWTADDHDRRLRALMASQRWYNREFRVYVAKYNAVPSARCLGRFIVREYPPSAELIASVDGVDIIGSEFSPFSLDRDVLGGAIFDKTRVPEAPKELLDAKRPIPVYMGVWSDESSAFAGVPNWRPYPLRGGIVTGTDAINGYGDAVSSATPPTSVTATAAPGGTLSPSDTFNNEYGFLVTAIDASGKESDPYPFHMHGDSGGGRGAFPSSMSTIHGTQAVPKATIDGTQKIVVSWSGATGAVKYRCYIGSWYYLARYSHYIETTATSCEWVSLASGVPADFTGGGGGGNIWYYVVIAKLSDGVTGKSSELTAVETGPLRVLRGWFTPVAGAIEYLVARRGTVGGFTRQFHVPASQIEGGWVYFTDDQTNASGEVIDGLPVPQGLVPIIDIGDETVAGATWGKFAVARWAWHKIIGVYAGGVRLSNTDPNVLHPDMTTWPWPASRTRPLGDCDCTVIYLRGSVLTAHRDGTAIVKLNACTTEEVGDGTGSTITQAARGVQHLITELVLNDTKAGPWHGIPAFADGVPMLRSSSYVRAEAVQVARVGGTGYTIRLAIDQPTPIRDFIQRCVQSFGLHHGINRHGQIVCGHYDDAVDPARVYPSFTDAREIVGNLGITPRGNELETTIPYSYDYRPADQKFNVTDGKVVDASSIAENRGKEKVGQARELAYTADVTTVTDVMNRALMLGRSVRNWIEVPVGIVGLSVDVFDVIQITDEAGIGAVGYQDAFVLVLEHEVRPADLQNDTPLTVMLRGIDVTALLDTAWAWGPESLTTWDTMSADDRGTYGAWADDTDHIPSDLSDAREWR